MNVNDGDQETFNQELQRLLTSDEREAWAEAGRRFAENDAIYELVPTAVDHFERFAEARQGYSG